MTSNNKNKIVVIVGPTASGKSGLAIKLAQKFFGEVVSADSRQVYRGMDIGTGKITKKEAERVPHHLLSIANPKNQFSASKYKKLAEKAVQEICVRQNLPIVVGGTGFYIDTLIRPALFPDVPPNPTLRKKLQRKSVERLSEILKKLDRQAWVRIDKKNPRRLIRAIELAKALGKIPKNSKEERSDWDILLIGLNPDPTLLKKKISERLLARFKGGMVAEVKKLKKSGLSWKKLDDFGLEYRHIARYLQSKTTRKELFENLKKDIEHYAKRQMTWFRQNKKIRWVRSQTEAQKLIRDFLKN